MQLLTWKIATCGATAVACGLAATVVLIDPKPASAPLKPPVNQPVAVKLQIPPSCSKQKQGPLTHTEKQIVAQIRQAATATDRRAILATLTPTQRMDLSAYLRIRSGSGHCGDTGPDPTVAPSISSAAPGSSPQPMINTYAS